MNESRRGRAGRWSAATLVLTGIGLAWAGDEPLARRLTATSVLEADLARGETHRYEIELGAGDYLDVVLDQSSMDIVPVVLGPDGTRLFRNDTLDWGREEVAIVASVSGIYRLDVAPAKDAVPLGRYTLRVEALRPATPGDRARAHVLDLQSQAYGAYRPPAAAGGSAPERDLPRARALYAQALDGWRALHDRMAEGSSLMALAMVANSMDDFPLQLEFDRQAAQLYHEAGESYAEARVLRDIGVDHDILGESADAVSMLERSLAIQRALGNLREQGQLMYDFANSYGAAGDLSAALSYAYQAVDLARRVGDEILEAKVKATIARAHLDLGEYLVCVDICRGLLELSTLDEVLRARVNTVLGSALVRLGDRTAARQALEESLAVWNKRNWRGFQAGTLIALGDLHVQDGNFEPARSAFELAATQAGAAGVAASEAIARRRLAETLIRLGRLDEAEGVARTVAELSKRDPNLNSRAFDMVVQAKLALAKNDFATARRQAEAALSLSESARGLATSGRVRNAMLASSQMVYETLIQVLMAEHAAHPAAGYDKVALEVSERARARSLLEMVLSGRPGTATGPDADPLDRMRSVQLRLNAKAQALDGAQRVKNAARIASLTRDIDELTDTFTVLEARMRRDRSPRSTILGREPLTLSSIRAKVLDGETLLVEYFLSDTTSYAWVVSRNSIESHRLAPRKSIEEAAGAFLAGISAPPSGSVERRASREAAAARLGDLLLAPLRGVGPGKRLLIVAPGALQALPFAALAAPGSPQLMVDRYEIVQAPSASIIEATRRTRGSRTAPTRAVAIFADPVFEADDPRVPHRQSLPPTGERPIEGAATPLGRALRSVREADDRSGLARLPFSHEEAEAIAALAPAGSVRVATGFEASLASVTDPSLADYRVVHFATHGFLDARTPELSGLVFSLVDERGSPQEGYLRLHELGRLHLNADLAVLSGCETGLGRAVEGEGVIGLTRGFVLAGARGVLASLWKVDDSATAELMERFYRGLLVQRLPAPAALREAQRQMSASDRWSDPYYWAGFVIQGEWR